MGSTGDSFARAHNLLLGAVDTLMQLATNEREEAPLQQVNANPEPSHILEEMHKCIRTSLSLGTNAVTHSQHRWLFA